MKKAIISVLFTICLIKALTGIEPDRNNLLDFNLTKNSVKQGLESDLKKANAFKTAGIICLAIGVPTYITGAILTIAFTFYPSEFPYTIELLRIRRINMGFYFNPWIQAIFSTGFILISLGIPFLIIGVVWGRRINNEMKTISKVFSYFPDISFDPWSKTFLIRYNMAL